MSVNELTVLKKNTARLVIVKNPFQPWNGRIIKEIKAGQKISDIVKNEYQNLGCDIYVSVNGKTIPINDYEILGGEIVTLSPVIGKGGGGKNIIGMIAMVALAVVSYGVMGVAGGTTAGLFGSTIAGATMSVWGYVAAAATMFIGGSLISRAFYSQPKVKSENTESEQSYSWSGPQTMEGQNNPIQMTYGKVLSSGQTIAKYVSIADNKEYLNWLLGCGEGELTFSDIMINDNPYSYYSGVKLETRSGTNNQSVISYFNDTYATKGLGYELLDNSARVDSISGNATQGLIVKVEFQQGLYHYSSSGKVKEASVSLKCEYRVVGSSTWTTFYNGTVYGSQTSALRKEFRVDNLSANEYEVRVQVTGRSADRLSTNDGVKVWWTSLTSIVYDDFAYPNTALIGVRALATDQINGSPTIKFIKERKYIWAYNPHTKAYEQKPANNPAWACYDMLHLASRLYNINTNKYEFDVRGVPANSLIYDQFNEWASFCNSKEFYVNIEITSLGEMLNVINDNIACIGHGMVVRYGTRYGCVWYCAKQPVQMFGMGNIISGTFNEEFLSTSDRANCIEITYIDKDHDYNKETITLYGDNYDSDATENATQVTFNGITSYEQAYREGKYQLYCNKYLLRTVSFEANIDSIACTVGDVILVSHDVTSWAYSGRITNIDYENRYIFVPVRIENEQETHRIMYRTKNDVLHTSTVSIVENNDDNCVLFIDEEFDKNDLPCVNDVFDVALNTIGSKPFIVKSISRSQDFTRKIECIEYNENLYNEQYGIPPIEYSMNNTSNPKNVTGLNASQVAYTTDDGIKSSRIYVSWNIPDNGGRFTVMLSTDNKNWSVLQSGISSDSFESDVAYGYEYYVKVITVLGMSKSKGVAYGPISYGIDEPPSDVKNIDVEILRDGVRRYYWDFEYPKPNDIAGFRFKYIQGNYPNWSQGYELQKGLVTSQPYEATTIRQGVNCIMVKAVDNAGQESKNPAYCIFDFGEPLEENVLFKNVFVNGVETDINKIDTNGTVFADGSIHARQISLYYKGENNQHWSNEDEFYWEQQYGEFYLSATTKTLTSGYFWLQYEITGIYNLTYRIKNKDNIFKQYSTKIYVEAGDEIEILFESQSTEYDTVLTKLIAIVDVPDEQEHFENITISANGTELPISVKNYYTTAIHIDNLNTSIQGAYELEIVSRQPCVIKFNIIEKGAVFTKRSIDANVDLTWQGFVKEVIDND